MHFLLKLQDFWRYSNDLLLIVFVPVPAIVGSKIAQVELQVNFRWKILLCIQLSSSWMLISTFRIKYFNFCHFENWVTRWRTWRILFGRHVGFSFSFDFINFVLELSQNWRLWLCYLVTILMNEAFSRLTNLVFVI